MNRKCLDFLILLTLLSISAEAQDSESIEAVPYKSVEFDMNTQTLKNYIPYDEPFLIKGIADSLTVKVACSYKESGGSWVSIGETNNFVKSTGYTFNFFVKRLKPNQKYEFKVEIEKKLPSEEIEEFSAKAEKVLEKSLMILASSKKNSFSNIDYSTLQSDIKKELESFNHRSSDLSFDFSNSILDLGSATWNSKNSDFDDLLQDHFDRLAYLTDYNAAKARVYRSIKGLQSQNIHEKLLKYATGKDVKEKNILFKIKFLTDTDLEKISFGYDRLKSNTQVISPRNHNLGRIWGKDSINFFVNNVIETKTILTGLKQYLQNEFLVNSSNRSALIPGYDKMRSSARRGALRTLDAELTTYINDIETILNRMNTVQLQLEGLSTSLVNIKSRTSSAVSEIRLNSKLNITLKGNSSEEFVTRGSWYIGSDFGFTFFPNLKETRPYFGVNIYFTPVNKRASYRLSDVENFKQFLLKRTSLTVGLPIGSIKDEDKGIEGLFGDSSLMVGIGFRMGRSFKVSYGLMWFKADTEPNPLLTKMETKSSNFISISVDADLLGLFGKLGTIIFK